MYGSEVGSMFEFLIYLLVNAFWISLILGTLTLFVFRGLAVILYQIPKKEAWQVLLIPCSIGFFFHVKEVDWLTKTYRILIIVFFVTTLIASLFLFYMHLELDFIYGIQGSTQTI